MAEDGMMRLSAEEQNHIEKMRAKNPMMQKSVAGIGTGTLYWKARRNKKQFLDEATYVEKEGNPFRYGN